MSMHLCKPGLTTTYKKRVQKITKAKQLEFEQGWRDRNQQLRQLGLPKETFEQYIDFVHGHSKEQKNKITKTNNSGQLRDSDILRRGDISSAKSLDTGITGACSSKPKQTYTGSEILGISVLHKSCLQPIFSNEAAIEVAKMRR